MHVLAGHQADRVLPVGAEFGHDVSQSLPATFGVAGRVVELNAFKKSLDDELLSVSVDRNGQAADLVMSNWEAIQQAQYREARRLKRVEALELEVRLVRAQNEALRVALETALEAAQRADVEAVTEGAASLDPSVQSESSEVAAGHFHVLRLGRFLTRFRQSRG